MRSVLFAEVMEFADLFDDEFVIHTELEKILNRAVPLHLLTDSESLFHIISKGSPTSEKRITLDIYVARQAYRKQRDVEDWLRPQQRQYRRRFHQTKEAEGSPKFVTNRMTLDTM